MAGLTDLRSAKVAIVHDYLTQRGGAERVVLSLHRLFPHAPIYTSIYDADGTFPEFAGLDVRATALGQLPGAGPGARALLPLYPAAFRSIHLRGYDLVISSSSGWAHGVRPGGAHHVVYCYTPARWLWRTDSYLAEGGAVPSWAAPALRPLFGALRRWDLAAARRPDLYVAISDVVRDRIAAVYGRNAPVVHPPVEVERLVHATEGLPGQDPADPYWLVVSRLLPYKRIDLAVTAATARQERLVVVGDGPARASLEAIAGPTVQFVPRVDEAELARLYAGCAGVIFAGEEDFGLVPLEANAAGRPVAAYAAGGALETVADGVTGALFAEQTVASLGAALDRIAASSWDAAALRTHARSFAEERFHERLLAAIEGSRAG